MEVTLSCIHKKNDVVNINTCQSGKWHVKKVIRFYWVWNILKLLDLIKGIWKIKSLTLATYPEVCLRGRDLQKVARVDPKPILRAFLQEIQNKFPTVCGCPIKLQSKAKFPYPDLLSSGQVTCMHLFHPNVSLILIISILLFIYFIP